MLLHVALRYETYVQNHAYAQLRVVRSQACAFCIKAWYIFDHGQLSTFTMLARAFLVEPSNSIDQPGTCSVEQSDGTLQDRRTNKHQDTSPGRNTARLIQGRENSS